MKFCVEEPSRKSSGIYRIKCEITGRIYIGSASEFLHRYNAHMTDLRRGVHPNSYLQNAYVKYGPNNFSFEIVEICEIDLLMSREQHHLDETKSYERDIGYNICKTAGRVDMTEEIRHKIGNANRGHVVSDETRRKISEANKGRKHSDQSLKNVRAAAEKKRGVKRPAEVGIKVSASKKASGYRHSEETREKQRAAFERNREKRLAQLAKIWESRRAAST